MSSEIEWFINQNIELSRRYFLRCGSAGIVAISSMPLFANGTDRDPVIQKAIDKLETWLTDQEKFRDVSRGTPKPHSLPEEKKKEVGMTRETWSLEVLADPENKTRLRNPLTKEKNTAFKFDDLMKLAEKHSVRFAKIMTCLNLGCPLGNGIWEGVPLREVLWLTQPTKDYRRVHYYGYHNDDPKQMFRSSLPVGRILEDLYGLPPVILCYKLNGQWLSPERGGPVRIVVPEAYGFKSIKWVSHIFLSNTWKSNDTYGEKNNDVDSPLKTFCELIFAPPEVKPDQPIALTGYAQVGISGLKKVQVWIHNNKEELPKGDKYFTKAPWQDAEILPPPKNWGGGLPENKIPSPTHGFDSQTGQPKTWPMKLAKVHWAALHSGLPAGEYTLRCRTVDENGTPQPMPRPYAKSGRAIIDTRDLTMK